MSTSGLGISILVTPSTTMPRLMVAETLFAFKIENLSRWIVAKRLVRVFKRTHIDRPSHHLKRKRPYHQRADDVSSQLFPTPESTVSNGVFPFTHTHTHTHTMEKRDKNKYGVAIKTTISTRTSNKYPESFGCGPMNFIFPTIFFFVNHSHWGKRKKEQEKWTVFVRAYVRRAETQPKLIWNFDAETFIAKAHREEKKKKKTDQPPLNFNEVKQ